MSTAYSTFSSFVEGGLQDVHLAAYFFYLHARLRLLVCNEDLRLGKLFLFIAISL
jgi:hypothetical protein